MTIPAATNLVVHLFPDPKEQGEFCSSFLVQTSELRADFDALPLLFSDGTRPVSSKTFPLRLIFLPPVLMPNSSSSQLRRIRCYREREFCVERRLPGRTIRTDLVVSFLQIIGLILGGALLVADYTWIFFFITLISIPFAIICIFIIPKPKEAVFVVVPHSNGEPTIVRKARFDYGGTFFQIASITLLIYALTEANVKGW